MTRLPDDRWRLDTSKHHSRIRIEIAVPDTNPAPALVLDRVDIGTPSVMASLRNSKYEYRSHKK